MVLVNINGVPIDFPFPPYGCQVKYMRSVIQCLENRQNGILESPTGTGKTLCLLCATLAWREKHIADKQLSRLKQPIKQEEIELSKDENGISIKSEGFTSAIGPLDVPKIIYASRTHSQLSQAVNELKNTSYRPKVAVLGSRDHLCIHPDVIKQTNNTAKIHTCRSKVNSRSCHFYNNVEAQKTNKDIMESILDIEDLAAAGKKINTCPYYLSKEMRTDADIIFMPYNYVLDLKSHKANAIDMNNTILLLDEGHNVERVCEDSASFDLTSFDIACCVEECSTCLEILQQKADGDVNFGDDDSALKGASVDLNVNDVALVKAFFLKFEEAISTIQIDNLQKGLTKPGSFILEILEQQNINMATKDKVLEMIDQCNAFLAGQDSKAFKLKTFALHKFSDAIKVVFSQMENSRNHSNKDSFKDFRVHIQVQKSDPKYKKAFDAWSKTKYSASDSRTLSYWCFTPGKTMDGLLQRGARSIVLTSGTLSPMGSMKCELRIPFPVELQNTHVVTKDQFFVGIIKQGPNSIPLNSSYGNRFSSDYQMDLGRTIVNLARVIPHGLLVFFPSYPVMNLCLEKWQETGIWSRLSAIKALYIEPRKKDDFNDAMENFYKSIENPELNGAAFFAVCRGKVSEGLDFANNNGRAVIITGLPFPPTHDPKVELKMGYLNELKKTTKGSNVITGQEWYVQQASRAVNQAIGRVIRHKNDFGAILLCDERFATDRSISQLPGWIGGNAKIYDRFECLPRLIASFFRNIKLKNEGIPARDSIKSDNLKHHSMNGAHGQKSFSKSLNAIPRNSNTEASLSLATIKANEDLKNSGNLFESLSVVQQKKECTPQHFENDNSEEIGNETKTVIQESTVRKIKIVRKSKESLEMNSAAEGGIKADENANAMSFAQKVKKFMTKDSYKIFGQAIKEYHKNKEIKPLLVVLNKVVTENKYDPDAFADLKTFIREKGHAKVFEKMMERLRQRYEGNQDTGSSISASKSTKRLPELECGSSEKRFKETKETHTSGQHVISGVCLKCKQENKYSIWNPCDHITCRKCLQESIDKNMASCPHCKKPFRRKDINFTFYTESGICKLE